MTRLTARGKTAPAAPLRTAGGARPARVSAPGKLILMGEHSVVYGHPAVAAAVQRRLNVAVAPVTAAGESVVELKLGDAAPVPVPWRAALRLAEEAGPGAAVAQGDPRFLAIVALGEAARLLGRIPPSLALEVRSEIPAGHGMGSSAALALSIIAAVASACGEDLERTALEAAAHAVERRQHGSPSGLDAATVLRGGVIRTGEEAGSPRFRPLVADPAALARFRVFDSGCPLHGTGEVVASVRRRLEADAALERELETMGDLARDFTDCLTGSGEPTAVGEAIRRFEAALEALGVVPPAARRLIRRIEAAGGAAKISGAGGLCDGADGRPGAGMILVHHEDSARIREWSFLNGLRAIDAPLGGPGLAAA